MTPKNTCHELIDMLSKAKTVEEIHSLCATFCKLFEFDRMGEKFIRWPGGSYY